MSGNKIVEFRERYYPAQVGVIPPAPGDVGHHSSLHPVTTFVLVSGDIGDYAAYVGHGSAVWVAQFGNKLRFEEALCYFPEIKQDKYRE